MRPDATYICGYAAIFADYCDESFRAQIAQVGEAEIYGAIFVLDPVKDGRRKKWTMFTTDWKYAQLLASSTGTALPMDPAVLREKFPAFASGWMLDDASSADAADFKSE